METLRQSIVVKVLDKLGNVIPVMLAAVKTMHVVELRITTCSQLVATVKVVHRIKHSKQYLKWMPVFINKLIASEAVITILPLIGIEALLENGCVQ